MDSFPFFLFLVVLVSAIFLGISFFLVDEFSLFSAQNRAVEGYNLVLDNIRILREGSDVGSFTKVNIVIPRGYKLIFSAENNTLALSGAINITNNINADIIKVSDKYGVLRTVLELRSGNYEIVLYYGNVTSTIENYEIFFR